MTQYFRYLVFAGLTLTAGTSVSIGVLGLNGIFSSGLVTHVLVTGMGLGLEAGKYAIIVYLHSRWHQISWRLRVLMMFVTLVVMSLTSFEVLSLLSQQQLLNGETGSTLWALATVYGISQSTLTAVISLAVTLIVEPMGLVLTFASCGMLGVKASKPKRKKPAKPAQQKPKHRLKAVK